MAVYVDNMQASFGRMIMCHMWADSLEELLAMADQIGVSRRWLQQPPKASWVHFDVAKSKRALAIHYGAIETDQFGPSEHTARLKLQSSDPAIRAHGEKMLAAVENCRARRVTAPAGTTSKGDRNE